MDKNGTDTTLNHQLPQHNHAAESPLEGIAGFVLQGQDGPTEEPIWAIHRGPSGYIPLATKDDGRTWRELGAIAVGQPFLPGLLRQLATDGYFGLNTSYGTKPRFRTSRHEAWERIPGELRGEQLVTKTRTNVIRTNPDSGLPYANHTTSTLRWLNVAYADLDCYRLGLSVGDTLGALINMQDAGTIPPATMFARSGRGLWAFWFLLDGLNPSSGEKTIHGQRHQPWTPARASRRNLALYARVQNAIVRKLTHLGADLSGVDGPRFAPVPGTVKTHGADRVEYWVQALASGPPAYTLPGIAAALGCALVPREHPVIEAALTVEPHDAPKAKNPKRQSAALKGWHVRWLNTVADLEMLRRLRDGLGEWDGFRNRFAFYYAAALYRAGCSKSEVEDRVLAFAIHTGLTAAEARAACKQGFNNKAAWKHLRRETYLTELRVTAAERSYLDASRAKPEPAPTAGRASIQGRREAILEAIDLHFGGRPPSVRVLADFLSGQGIPCGNHSTIHRDYQKLGLVAATKAGRPPKLPL